MPRGRCFKSLSIGERITAVEADIESLQERFNQRKAELKELQAQKQEADKERLMEAVNACGMTIDDVISLLMPPMDQDECIQPQHQTLQPQAS